MFATSLQSWAYRRLAKPLFFRQDPETVHDRVLMLGRLLGSNPLTRAMTAGLFRYRHPSLEQTVAGVRFANPVGLSAGFDKNAELIPLMPAVGFGFVEVGSVTGEPCEGNPKPRLWRLPKSEALVVYYGLKSDGCEKIAARLAGRRFGLPVGISVAKTNSQATVERAGGIADYAKAFRTFAEAGLGDYITVNLSCPNTCGGQPFVDPESLEALLTELDRIPYDRPIFIKLGVDLTTDELDALVAVADRHRVSGFVLCNLTKDRTKITADPDELAKAGPGGISGRPVQVRSNQLISHLYRTAGERYVIIGVGGIFSAEDAYEKIRRGASLVQLITGMVYRGPQLIGQINRDLVRLLRRDGYENVSQAVGADHR